MQRIRPEQIEKTRAGARRIWQGKWNRRILLLVVFYATVESALFTLFDTGTWDTPLLFAYLAVVSVAMVVSHRRWFSRVEADLESGELETVTGPVRYPSRVEAMLLPGLRFTVFVGGEPLRMAPDADSRPEAGQTCTAEVLPSTRVIIVMDTEATDA